MNPLRTILFTIACLLSASTAFAQDTYPANPAYVDNTLGTIPPYQGTYYDPKQSGTGIQVDLGNSGNAFVTLYSYTPTGAPTWYILAASYKPSDELTRYTTGVIGTMTGPFYNATGGQCLGCPYTPTGGAVLSPFTAILTWVNSREVKMVVGDQSWDFIAPNFDSETDGDYLAGSWATTVTEDLQYQNNPAHTYTYTEGLALTPAQYPVVVDSKSTNETPIPASAQTYMATCGNLQLHGFNTLCPYFLYSIAAGGGTNPDFEYSFQVHLIFWYDKTANRLGLDIAELKTVGGKQEYVIGPLNAHYDLYLEGPNFIVGRGINEGVQPAISSNKQGGLQLSLSMVKLPGATVSP